VNEVIRVSPQEDDAGMPARKPRNTVEMNCVSSRCKKVDIILFVNWGKAEKWSGYGCCRPKGLGPVDTLSDLFLQHL
jgi:hypothetical protein